MKIWKMPASLEDMNQRGKNSFSDYIGIQFTELGEDYLVATMPIADRIKQPIGIMHGGASCVLAETVGSTAANYCVDQAKQYCVGLDINTNHIRAIRSGIVTAKATPYHLGGSTQVWHIEIVNETKKIISINRLTMMVINR